MTNVFMTSGNKQEACPETIPSGLPRLLFIGPKHDTGPYNEKAVRYVAPFRQAKRFSSAPPGHPAPIRDIHARPFGPQSLR